MDSSCVEPAGIAPVKRGLLLALLTAAALFAALLFAKAARQNEIFTYDELCDYRMFILPCMTSAVPYSAPAVRPRDACYPPIAYCAVKALSADRGVKWSLSAGEIRLLLSLLLAQCIGVVLLVRRVPWRGGRVVAAAALLLSPACICTLLRGNPSGWSFALVCVFLCWYKSNEMTKRVAAAVALGTATSLKLTPCLFGLLYLAEAVSPPRRIPWADIFVSAASAVLLVFLPFFFFGGVGEISQWISNAGANAEFYAADNPLWGFAALANHIIDSKEVGLPCIGRFAWATRVFAAVLAVAGVFARSGYRRLLCIGAAMAFLTHHDYGGAYLLPAFVAWLCDEKEGCSGVKALLEAVAWFLVLTPLQIPNPCFCGSLNGMLQNEALLLLLLLALLSVFWRGRPLCRRCHEKGELIPGAGRLEDD